MWESGEKGKLWHSRPGNLVKPEGPETWAGGPTSKGQVYFKPATVGQTFPRALGIQVVYDGDVQKK